MENIKWIDAYASWISSFGWMNWHFVSWIANKFAWRIWRTSHGLHTQTMKWLLRSRDMMQSIVIWAFGSWYASFGCVKVMTDMPFDVRHLFSACRVVTPYWMRLVSQSCKIDKKRFFEQKWARCLFCSTKIRKNFSDWTTKKTQAYEIRRVFFSFKMQSF